MVAKKVLAPAAARRCTPSMPASVADPLPSRLRPRRGFKAPREAMLVAYYCRGKRY